MRASEIRVEDPDITGMGTEAESRWGIQSETQEGMLSNRGRKPQVHLEDKGGVFHRIGSHWWRKERLSDPWAQLRCFTHEKLRVRKEGDWLGIKR